VKEIIFVIGGCRSGKSSHALRTAEKMPQNGKIYIATCVPQDQEMKQRVERHQRERSQIWVTVEEPLQLPEAILHNSDRMNVILVDCLTLWVSNLLMKTNNEEKLQDTNSQLLDALEKAAGSIVLVSNEVGAGIVPENKLARQYRDIIGLVNQAVAQAASKVVWMVAGIPVTVKGQD
jgi:adenosylcobinamide kinase/adenosylcobinamide-phosphate guanylyltransferase